MSILRFFLVILSNLFILSCQKEKLPAHIPDPDFNTNLTYGTLLDIDSNIYKTITIGTQIWMAENLRTTRLNDSSRIPLVKDNSEWAALFTSGYCWFEDDDISYKKAFGALYNWFTVNTGKLCPKSWHVPVRSEWITLALYLNENGGKLKESGITHWVKPNMGATNESGFTALPGGFRSSAGFYYGIGQTGFWWSATECTECYKFPEWNFIDAGDFSLGAGSSGYGNQHDNMLYGYSIRCVKN